MQRAGRPAGRASSHLTSKAIKTVLLQILQLKRRCAQLPFFELLRDPALTARERLAFYPCMAPFILSFGDLNRCVLRDESSDDPLQAKINRHSYEDEHHWPWYLEDFAKLGHDQGTRPTETMRRLYGDASAHNRVLAHRPAHRVWNAAPAVQLAIVEAIEETGNVLFALTSQLAREVERDEGIELRCLGVFHFALESGHAMNNEHRELAAIELDPAQRAQAPRDAGELFRLFGEWTSELLRCAQAERTTEAAPC